MKNLNIKFIILLMSFLSVWITSQGQRIFPGAVGYGTETRGAYGSEVEPIVLTVDTLYAGVLQTGTYSGSFQWAVTQTYPRIVVFEVGGVIDYSSGAARWFEITSPYINIYGQTAPDPGITIKSMAVYFNSHDLLMQNIAIRYGDYLRPDGTVDVEDCFTALSGSYNIVLDHCSFSWGSDELFGVYSGNFTISNCLLYEALHYSYHANESAPNEPEAHGFGAIVRSPIRASIYNNLFGWFTNRFPHIITDSVIYINNYATGYALTGVDVSAAATGNNGAFIGNNFYPTPSMTDSKSEYFSYWRMGLNTLSTIYMNDNNCIRKDSGFTERQCVFSYMPSTNVDAIFTDNSASNVLDISEYNIVPADDVIDSVLVNSGSRPWNRDYFDSLAIVKLKAGEQDYLNSPRAQPAKAYNLSVLDGLLTRDGNMLNGYDFSANNVSFTVNSTSINLTTNTTNQSQVLSAINAQLPSGTEAIDHPNPLCHHIIIQTTSAGANQQIVIGGDASVFGIANGTYVGQDAPYIELNYTPTRHTLGIPSNPHCDGDNDGYTNIEEWAYALMNSTFVADTACADTTTTDTTLVKIAYVTSNRVMDTTATSTDNDTIIRMLRADENLDVTVFAVADNATVDFTGYDVAIIQESFGSTADILKPTGSAGLENIHIPFIYNKVYALRDNRAVDTGGGTSADISSLSITVDPSFQSNELFDSITFTNNAFDVFHSTANDNGGDGTKSLNYTYGLSLSDTTSLLGTATGITDTTHSIFINDLDSGAQIGSEVLQARMIAFGMNFGAISADYGTNMTSNGLRLWHNAVYSLAGLNDTVPSVPDTTNIQVAYITYNKTMDTSATAVTNDTIIGLLEADDNFDVTVFAVGSDSTISLSGFDIAVVQESFSSLADILKPTGSAGLANINIPFIYNKVYALQNNRAVSSGGGSSGDASGLAITVSPAHQSNELFNGISFTNNEFSVFDTTASDYGGVGTKALNYTYNLTISDTTTLIGTVSEITDTTNSIFLNDIPAGTTVGSETLSARMIAFGMNFGAMSKDHGTNITSAGITLWRNAFYSLAGLTVPTTPVTSLKSAQLNYVAEKEVEEAMVKVYPNPVNDKLNISANDKISKVLMYDLLGTKILEITPQSNNSQIDLHGMPPGTYILKIKTGNRLELHKILKR
jgi:hypothetical protein